MKYVLRGMVLMLVALPVFVAVFGPALAEFTAQPAGVPFVLEPPYPWGTDGLGRDVLTQLLLGGRPTIVLATAAVAACYLFGATIGLVAASVRQFDEILLRPLDVLLAVPSLLLLSMAAVWWQAQFGAIVIVVALVNLPAVARLVRTAALESISGQLTEVLLVQGEPWWKIQLRHVGRSVLRPLLADVGTRITAAVYLVASANFLGLGLDPASPDWAVSVARSQEGLLLQPWAVLAPTAMIVAFTVGLNLLWDQVLGRPSDDS